MTQPKRLLLINPVGQKSGYLLSGFSTVPPLNLAYIAAVTPSGWHIKIADENFDELEFEEADLVGITAFSSNIVRAYEIARKYRERGTKVVIGGIHASMLPEEALCYADAVVVGEAEGIWQKVLDDFESNCLSGKYVGPRVDLEKNSIKPRRDLLDPRYFIDSIQTSRGCPFDCHFCSVSKYLGKDFRQRRPDDVLDELEEIKGKYLFFLDDNLIGHSRKSRKRAKAIFAGMLDRGIKKRWWMQTSIDAADDEEVLRMAAKAGCIFAFVGIESISERTLNDMKKGINLHVGVKNYKRAVGRFHKYGIGFFGAFIIGSDHESPAYYKELAKFIVDCRIDIINMTILTPLPGTELMEEMEKKGRLFYTDFPDDWAKYRLSHVVHHPEGLDPETIYTGDNYIKNHVYKFPINQIRMIRSFISIGNLLNFYVVYRLNKALRRSWQGSHYYEKYPRKLI